MPFIFFCLFIFYLQSNRHRLSIHIVMVSLSLWSKRYMLYIQVYIFLSVKAPIIQVSQFFIHLKSIGFLFNSTNPFPSWYFMLVYVASSSVQRTVLFVQINKGFFVCRKQGRIQKINLCSLVQQYVEVSHILIQQLYFHVSVSVKDVG